MANLYVNHVGSDSYPYASEATGTPHIQTALDAAAAGDTVWVKNNWTFTYDGIQETADSATACLTCDATTDIRVAGYHTTAGDCDPGGAYYQNDTYGYVVLDGGSYAGSRAIIDVQNTGWRFDNLKLQGGSTGRAMFYNDTNKANLNCRNLWLVGADKNHGLTIKQIDQVVLEDLRATGSFSGYRIINLDGTSLHYAWIGNARLYVAGADYGIYLYPSFAGVISHCELYGYFTTAIRLIGSTKASRVQNCTLVSNTAGVGYGIIAEKYCQVYGNILKAFSGAISYSSAACRHQDYNAYAGNTSEAHGINLTTDDPRFADAASNNFTVLNSRYWTAGPYDGPIGARHPGRRTAGSQGVLVGAPLGAF